MLKLFGALLAASAAFGAAPAMADEPWSEFDSGRRYNDRPYVYFVPSDFGRSGRFVSWDDGYFARGGGVEVSNNSALFDYDRDYPYEYRSSVPSGEAEEHESYADYAVQSCTVEWVRDARTGERTDVRVCRN
nr:hypothetical protein [uncultured Sphingosinicella sp.]